MKPRNKLPASPIKNFAGLPLKNKNANNTSFIGYYAEVKLTNNSNEEAELYSLNSEIAESSK